MAIANLDDVHSAIAHLRRLTEVFQRRRAQLAADVGLTEHQWGLLEEISSEHFMPSMFAKQQQSSAAAVSKTIRQLVDKGLVSVSLAETDSRQRRYELTKKGRVVMDRLRSARQEVIERVWLRLDPAALHAFNEFAQGLTEQLEKLLVED